MINSVITFSAGVIVGVALSGGAVACRLYKRRSKQPTNNGKKAETEAMISAILQTASNCPPEPQTLHKDVIPQKNLPEADDMEADIRMNDTPSIAPAVPDEDSRPLSETAPECIGEKEENLAESADVSPAVEPTEAFSAGTPVTEREEKPTVFITGKFRDIANSATEEDLKMLLLDRLDEIDEEAPELTRQALCAVTLLDEIREMNGAYTEQNAAVLSELTRGVTQHLIELGCEVLDSDSWDASIQKIGKVTYDLPTGTEPVITAKLSSGLKIAGRIIRKQSVAISKSAVEL